MILPSAKSFSISIGKVEYSFDCCIRKTSLKNKLGKSGIALMMSIPFLRKNHKRIAKKKFCIKIKIESDDEKRRNIVGEK